MNRRHKRINGGALAAVIALLVIGCATGEESNPLGTAGGVSDGNTQNTSSPTPSPAPSTGSSASPTATPAPVPVSVSILPSSAKIWISANDTIGEALGMPSSVQLSATVTMSDASKHGVVTWKSLTPQIASVDATTGLVTAIGMGNGEGPWSVAIEALAPDGKTVGTRHISVYAEGGVDMIVQ
jgi:hypothetical protein